MKKLAILTMSLYVSAVFGSQMTLGASNNDFWPTWRGPDYSDVSPKGNPPLTWSEPYFFKEQLEGIDEVYASPAGAAGRVYFVGRNGVTCVIKCSEKLEVLAVSKLDDGIDCSPVFVGDELYLKGKEHLYCITTL